MGEEELLRTNEELDDLAISEDETIDGLLSSTLEELSELLSLDSNDDPLLQLTLLFLDAEDSVLTLTHDDGDTALLLRLLDISLDPGELVLLSRNPQLVEIVEGALIEEDEDLLLTDEQPNPDKDDDTLLQLSLDLELMEDEETVKLGEHEDIERSDDTLTSDRDG